MRRAEDGVGIVETVRTYMYRNGQAKESRKFAFALHMRKVFQTC